MDPRLESALIEIDELRLERDALRLRLAEVERVFGNASVFDAARGDIVEKARIAYRGGVESERLAIRLAAVERERDEARAKLHDAMFAAADGEFADSDARVSAAVAAERERCAKVESELRAALGKREDEWTAMHDAVRRCFWEGLSRDGRLIPSEQLTKRLIEARDLLHKIEGAPAPREG